MPDAGFRRRRRVVDLPSDGVNELRLWELASFAPVAAYTSFVQAICKRYGAAPKAFILVPVVGALLIDIANAIVISLFVSMVPALRN